MLRIPLVSVLFLTLILSSGLVAAQNATVYGTVRDTSDKPVFGVTVSVFGQAYNALTDDNGNYNLQVPSGQQLKIVFSSTGFRADSVTVDLKAGDKKQINIRLRGGNVLIKEVDIKEKPFKSTNVTPINPKNVSVIPTINQNVEDLVKLQLGVSSTNELSSTYSVRGGNYDENLVYINDFEVYRPQLVRSGQQEGLSVINPDMVESINFSAGGFDAVYGDKLSSVLDIKYHKPKKFGGSISASLLGESLELENVSRNKKWSYMAGIRQKSNQYILNTFETRGDYKPSFTDFQLLTSYDFSKRFSVDVFGNYARNRYQLVPETRETNFGTINDAKRFTVYFEGQEADRSDIYTGAISATYRPTKKTNLKFITSTFYSDEQENFDILGQYFLDQLEADLGKEEFGNVAFNLGVGSFLNHARNKLNATVYSAEHKGEYITDKVLLQWGARIQQQEFEDKLHEWNYNDSAGFSIPSQRDSLNPMLVLNDVVLSKRNLTSQNISGYLQTTWQITDTNKLILITGIRANYSDLNGNIVISPRASLTYKPEWEKRLSLRASGGFYYQPPFYRELRDIEGKLYTDIKAQKSIHAVVGGDFTFLAVGREFKLSTELYYKILENLIPYKVDNIRIRYLPNFTSKGYARGVDLRIFGEFVQGAESWLSISYMQTEEDLDGDHYYRKFNAEGEEIIPGYTFDKVVTDSIKVEPGYIPRPADQRMSFGLFFQDYLPNFPTYKMQLSLIFGTGMPFGPPGGDRFKDLLRTPTYRRVDIGFSKQLIGDEVKKKPKGRILKSFESVWAGIEVFNLLQVSNVASYTWITDISNARRYAVPNFLTGRQLNIRINAKF
jgi:hypothetical protein